MINGTKQRYLFAIDGVVNTTVGADSLGKGQFMVGDIFKPGIRPATNYSTTRKDEKRFKILVGEDSRPNTRSFTHGASETPVFSLDQIKEIRVTNPKNLKQEVDEWYIGWNGRTDSPETSLNFTNSSKPFKVFMTLMGKAIAFSGGGVNTEVVDFTYPIQDSDYFNPCADVDKCDKLPCQKIIEDVVERLKRKRTSSNRRLEEFVDISPIVSCVDSVATDELTYYTLDVCDTGDVRALSKIQGYFGGLPIKRLGRKGGVTTYQTLAESAPADYLQTTVEIIPTCSTCPSGWDTISGGLVYVVTIEDNGGDFVGKIEAILTNATDVVKIGNESGTGTGVYSVLMPIAVTDVQLGSFVSEYAGATVSLIGSKSTVCSDEVSNTIEWVAGETCDISQETYTIVLPDNECGQMRLAELQGAYPDLTIAVASDVKTSAITLTGTSGTANVTIGGVDYLATFTSDLTTSAANFVTTHTAALTTLGFTVSANTGVISLTTPVATTVAVSNVTTDLSGTIVTTNIPDREACSTRYVATVGTNMVCDECDDVFKDYFLSVAPEIYDGEQWVKETKSSDSGSSTDCLCGIRIKSKTFKMDPDNRYFYKVPFIESSLDINVSAGFQDSDNLTDTTREFAVPSAKMQKSFKKDRDMLAGDMLGKIRHSNMWNHGAVTGFKEMEDDFSGMSLPINNMGAQLVQISIDLAHDRYQQGFRSNDGVTTTTNIYVEYGKEGDVITELNKLAAAAGKQVYFTV